MKYILLNFSCKFISCFYIDQISKNNLKGDKRTLKNDPYKLTSTQEWRQKVLNRLYRMLLILSFSQSSSIENKENASDNIKKIEFTRYEECFIKDDSKSFNTPRCLKLS